MMTNKLSSILRAFLLLSGVTHAIGGEPNMKDHSAIKTDYPISLRALRENEIYVDHLGISPNADCASLKKRPRPTEEEKMHVGLRLSSVFLRHGVKLSIEHLKAPSVPHSNGLGGFPGDRSFCVEIENWKLLNKDVILDLAEELSRQPNRWRVMLNGRVRECAFCIYQDSVAFDALILKESLADSMGRAIELESRAYDSSQGNSDRQLEEVKEQFRNTFLIERQHPHIVVVFDNWRGQKGSCVIWVFHNGSTYHDFKLEPAHNSMDQNFEVRMDGTLHELYDLMPSERAGFLVECVRGVPLNGATTFRLRPTN
jgi:hypothetical protein